MAKLIANGEIVDEEEAKVSIFDHGFLYGDGVFEGIRAYNGYIFKLEAHLDRLYRSAGAITLDIPLDREEMTEMIIKVLRENEYQDAYIRPIVSRGKGSLGIDPLSCNDPNVFIITKEWESLYDSSLYETGLKAITTTIRNQPIEGLPPTVKSLNYLTNIMAKIQANAWGADEAIMLDVRGNVSEGAADNIFISRDGVVYTPPTMNNLPGITRATLIDMMEEIGQEVREQDFGLAEVLTADEVFVSGTAAEVAPVVEIDGRKIGDGNPGSLCLNLKEKFDEVTGKPETGVAIYQ